MLNFMPFLAGPSTEDITAITMGLAVLMGVSFIIMMATRFKRCPSNRILVIYGKVRGGQSARCLQGGGSFVWPLIQSFAFLNLDPIQIDIPLKGALSSENIRVNVPSVFTVAIATEAGIMQNAAVRLLGLTNKDITQQARDIIFGQLRQVIASMSIEGINRDRDFLLSSIQESMEPELNKIGLVLINVNITDITDESGYIEAIGRKAASEAIQQAEVDVALQRKLGAVGVAEANRDKEIEVAQNVRTQNIGTKDAERDQAVKLAELDKQKVIGEQSAKYEQETAVRNSEREMRIAVAAANATAVTGENEAKAIIAATDAELRMKEAEAYAMAESKHREAEAHVLSAQYEAQALAAAAEGRKVEAEMRAQLEAPARAAKAQLIVESEADAERVKIDADALATAAVREAEGEAEATYKRLEAEARGQYEILAKKGEGLKKIVEACGGAQEAFQLMMLEHIDNLAAESSKAIQNIKFDKITVWDGGGQGDGKGGAAGFLQSLGGAIPPLLDVMKNVGGVEMPEFLGKLVGEQDKVVDTPLELAQAAANAIDSSSEERHDNEQDSPSPKTRKGKKGTPPNESA
ncbi:MAG: flotillin [Planctomycetota bacterium]|jgi:flotillin